MIFPAWSRLVKMYQDRIIALLAAGIREPWPQVADTSAFARGARAVAEAMVRELAAVNARSWREAAMKASRGRAIYEALQDEIQRAHLGPQLAAIAGRNAELIQSVPGRVASQISSTAARMSQEGKRPEEIARFIRALAPNLTRSHVKLIARTEISKSETDITRARSEHIGLTVYQWQSSEDQRVRDSHRNMNGVLVFWSDPPQPEELIHKRSTLGHHHAGQSPNCRCISLPVVTMDEISWPARVYRHNSITRMSRAAFLRLVPEYQRAA